MINKNNFIKKIQEQFVEDINIDESTKFRDLDAWDSLTGMAIQIFIKDDYDIDLSVSEFKLLNTIGDIFDFVETNTTK